MLPVPLDTTAKDISTHTQVPDMKLVKDIATHSGTHTQVPDMKLVTYYEQKQKSTSKNTTICKSTHSR